MLQRSVTVFLTAGKSDQDDKPWASWGHPRAKKSHDLLSHISHRTAMGPGNQPAKLDATAASTKAAETWQMCWPRVNESKDKQLVQRSQTRWEKGWIAERGLAPLLRASRGTNISNLLSLPSFSFHDKWSRDFSVSSLSGGDLKRNRQERNTRVGIKGTTSGHWSSGQLSARLGRACTF